MRCLLALLLLLAGAGLAWAEEAPAAEEDESLGQGIEVRGRRSLSRDESEDAIAVPGERLRDSARGSTFEALAQESADVYVTGRGALHGVASGGSGGIHVRGLGGSPNSQVLVVEDGVPDYQGIFGHPIPDAYVPALIDEALIVKGGDSTLYGTNGMGGVIVLRSRWLADDGWELGNDAAYGSYRTARETATFLFRRGDWDAAAAFHVLRSDGHRAGAGGSAVVGHTAARWRPLRDLHVSLRNKVVRLHGGDPGPVTHPHTDHTYEVWRDNLSLNVSWRTGWTRLEVTPYLNVGVHRLYDGFHSQDYVGGGVATLELALHDSLEGLFGLAASHVDGRVEDRVTGERAPVEGGSEVAPFAQLTWRPWPTVSLVAGARFVHDTRYGATWLYKGGLRWDIWGGIHVRSRVSRNYRQPTIRELHLPYPSANPELRPERSLNWDFGLGYERRHLVVSVSGYRTSADDLIKYFGAWPTAEVVNIDHVVIWGVEGSVRLRELGPVSIRVGADWRDVGRHTRQNPTAKLDFSVELAHDFGRHFVGAALTGEWVHGLYMANYGRRPIDDVFAMDLALRYRYTDSVRAFALEPYLLLRNVLDARYAYVEHYDMPRFNLMAGLRVTL